MTADLDVGRGVVISGAELGVRFSRSGGPGGQNVNKRDTRVEITFDVTASSSLSPEQRRRVLSRLRRRLDSRGRLRVVSSAERTQSANRERALANLRDLLSDALRPPSRPRVPTKPTKAARERRLASKRGRARIKQGRATPDVD